MQTITSKDNQYLRLARSLHSKKGRQESGLLLAEGLRLAEEAARFAACRCALFSAERLEEERYAALAQGLESQGCLTLTMDERLLAAAAATDSPQGVLIIAQGLTYAPLPAQGPWYACVDQVADPGNMGTLIRSAAAAGCGGLLLSPQAVDPANPKAVRASMGAVFKLPLYRCATMEQAVSETGRLAAPPLVAEAGGADPRQLAAKLALPHTWVLGAEAAGPSPCWQGCQRVGLPMAQDMESLNVAAAAAVLFYQSRFAQSEE